MEIFCEQIAKINKDLSRMEPVQKVLFKNNSIDLMFILDCTGSMGSWINACKREINSLLEYVRQQNFGMRIRVSIIAYRDFEGRRNLESSLFSILPFTEEVRKPLKHLKRLTPDGGDDGPEDICGAFNAALE